MTQPPPNPPSAPPPNRRANVVIAVIVGIAAVFGALVVLGLIAQAIDDGDQAAETMSSTPTPSSSTAIPAPVSPSSAPAPTTAAPAPQPAAPPSSATPPAAPAPAPVDSRCVPAVPSLVSLVEAGLTHAGWRLTNATVIDAGGGTYFGATIVDVGGAVKERSDVWIIRDGNVYASTGGARNNSTFPKASAVGISPGDELVQAVDACVVAATRGR